MSHRDEILSWNLQFPLDRRWRLKYGVPLFSDTHLKVSQVEIYLDYLEDVLFEELSEKKKKLSDNKAQVEEGVWLRPTGDNSLDKEREEELFNNLQI